ncbi:MAG: 3-oxoacyl-ACP reductase FabG [Rickettsiales bacterium]|jgi:3-oxoacyl-[acyl-carrier protein] reductase|nr:3-oxoacyl-ACP reductase FabG [Rickettsiales bacterium]
MNLSGKSALITGGSRGIGAATALRLAKEGANVAITYSKSKPRADEIVKQIEAMGRKAVAIAADANNPDAMPAVVDQVVKALGGIDILVNNAGVFALAPIGGETREQFEQLMNVNVHSVYILTDAAVKIMKPGARIINVSSCLGERASGATMSSYAATKFAVCGFTRGWAKDLGARNILVNAVLPGPIDTEMNPDGSPYSDFQKMTTALGRYGKAEEIAGAIAFLAGPDATYITGATLTVDGGWNA